VIKKVLGAAGRQTQAVIAGADELPDDATMARCPAIYQWPVMGQLHLRVHCFGDRMYTLAVRDEALDWRVSLQGKFEAIELDKEYEHRLARFMETMELRMAIFDVKVDPKGKLWWLEANQQGQFLFMQGLSGVDLVTPFCEFLLKEATRASPG
jgi:hypothetical protein